MKPADILEWYPTALAVAAGPQFGRTASGTCGGGNTPCTRQLDLTEQPGVDLPPCKRLENKGLTLSVVGGKAHVRRGSEIPPIGVTVAVQLYPLLLWDRRVEAPGQRVSSAAGLGLKADGSLVSVISKGTTLTAFARIFLELGCTAAGYADAGSSACLYTRKDGFVGPHPKVTPKLPAWLVFLDPQYVPVPDRTIPLSTPPPSK